MNASDPAATPFGFVSVMVRLDDAPTATDAGANAFATVGGERGVTVSVALAAAEFAPALEVTAPAAIVFTYEFAAALVTTTVTVQLPFAGMVPPDSATEPEPAVAVTVPPQLVAGAGAAALTRPKGYVSVKAAAEAATPFGFVNVIVSVDVPATMNDAGAKLFATVGVALTEREAVAAPAFAPRLEVRSPAAIVFA